jgi:hypothetical protein
MSQQAGPSGSATTPSFTPKRAAVAASGFTDRYSKRKRTAQHEEYDDEDEEDASDGHGAYEPIRDDHTWTAGDAEIITSDNSRFRVPRELLISAR